MGTLLSRDEWKRVKRPYSKLENFFKSLSYTSEQVENAVDTIYSKPSCEFKNYYESIFCYQNNLPMPRRIIYELCDFLRNEYFALDVKNKDEIKWILRRKYNPFLLNGYCRMNMDYTPNEIIIICEQYLGYNKPTNNNRIPSAKIVKEYIYYFMSDPPWWYEIVPFCEFDTVEFKEKQETIQPSKQKKAKQPPKQQETNQPLKQLGTNQ